MEPIISLDMNIAFLIFVGKWSGEDTFMQVGGDTSRGAVMSSCLCLFLLFLLMCIKGACCGTIYPKAGALICCA
jgi:hypothetical protein